VVSIHDVSGRRVDYLKAALAALDAVGVRRRVLMVIPAEPGAPPLARGAELVRLLGEEAGRGSEVVMHGCTHAGSGPARGTLATRLRSRWLAREVAEFATCPPSDLRRRLLAGRSQLLGAGLEVEGFCAPGWLSTPELPELLAETGFRHLVGMGGVLDVRTGRRLTVPWGGHLGAGGLHEALVGTAGAAFLALAGAAPAVQVFVHPGKGDGHEIDSWKSTLARIDRLRRDREASTYRDLVGDLGAATDGPPAWRRHVVRHPGA
jgi:predicted deacetylase